MKTPAIAVACTFVLALSVPGSADAQIQAKPPVASPTMAEMLTELRALRAEMNRAAAAALRAQLLVARLALQEQRITSIGREMTEIQEKLQANERNRPVANLLKSMGKETNEAASDEPREPNFFLDAIRGQGRAIGEERSAAEGSLRGTVTPSRR